MCIHVHVHHHSARHATFFPLARGEMHRRENPGSRGERFFSFHAGRDAPEPRFPHRLRRRDKPTTPVHRGKCKPRFVRQAIFFVSCGRRCAEAKNPGSPHRLRRRDKPATPRRFTAGDANPGSRGKRFFSFHAGRDAPRRRTPVPSPSSKKATSRQPRFTAGDANPGSRGKRFFVVF